METSQRDVVPVKNVSNRTINTSKGHILPGKVGEATIAELRQLSKFLKRVKVKQSDHDHEVAHKVKSK